MGSFYEFVIYTHRHRLSTSPNDVTLHLLDNGFTLEETRRVALVFVHGTELLLQYDKSYGPTKNPEGYGLPKGPTARFRQFDLTPIPPKREPRHPKRNGRFAWQRYTSLMACTDCHKHHGINGEDRCLYCQGMNPPTRGLAKVRKQIRTFLERPVGAFHRVPDLVR